MADGCSAQNNATEQSKNSGMKKSVSGTFQQSFFRQSGK
jgi:hypothetical protein